MLKKSFFPAFQTFRSERNNLNMKHFEFRNLKRENRLKKEENIF